MKYDGTNLEQVLKAHFRWVQKEKGFTEDDKADFKGANLRYANLNGAVLACADFTGADLKCARFHEASLHGANFTEANLMYADFYDAYVIGAIFKRADISYASFRGANCESADFTDACAYDTDFRNAMLNKAKGISYIPMACPEVGEFIAWKKCRLYGINLPVIVKLLIPADAKRSSATGRKCRASKAKVLEIQTLLGSVIENSSAYSEHDRNFKYEVGKIVEPREPFCENRWEVCASGIHFFINRQEAVNY